MLVSSALVALVVVQDSLPACHGALESGSLYYLVPFNNFCVASCKLQLADVRFQRRFMQLTWTAPFDADRQPVGTVWVAFEQSGEA